MVKELARNDTIYKSCYKHQRLAQQLSNAMRPFISVYLRSACMALFGYINQMQGYDDHKNVMGTGLKHQEHAQCAADEQYWTGRNAVPVSKVRTAVCNGNAE